MADPQKRPGSRPSSEDVAFYRKFHASALSSLRKGIPREEIVRELVRRGVPETTADRIGMAVEHEHATSSEASQGLSKVQRWLIAVVLMLAFEGLTVYFAIQLSEDKRLEARYLVPAMIVSVVFLAVGLTRLFGGGGGPNHLPPPPEPP